MPMSEPSAARIGAALSSIGVSRPSRDSSNRVIREADDAPLAEHFAHRIFHRLARLFLHDVEDVLDRAARSRPPQSSR